MNKQIEIDEMAKDIRLNMQIKPNPNEHPSHQLARLLVKDGYRKTSTVAREIFEEIEQEIKLALDSNYEAKQEHYDNHYRISTEFIGMVCGKIDALRGMQDYLAELKKKYESEGEE